MHLPEEALFAGSLGYARNQLRAGMDGFIGKMPEHIDEAIAKRFAQSGKDRPKPPAIRAEVISVENDSYGSFGRRVAA